MKELIENNGFINLCNIKIDDIDKGILHVNLSSIHNNPYDIAHGGLIFTLADTAMGIFLVSEGNFVTVNSSINFLKPAKSDLLTTNVEKLKIGKNIAVLNCNIYNEKNELISSITGTYSRYNK